jgi:hypothetical protein
MDPQRLQFWIDFIVSKAAFPSPERLAAQFNAAQFSEFCDCGCNSFKVSVPVNSGIEQIALPTARAGVGAIFQSSFRLVPSGKSLEIVLFADAPGNLAYVEIHCNANSEPVPESITVQDGPYHMHGESSLAP